MKFVFKCSILISLLLLVRNNNNDSSHCLVVEGFTPLTTTTTTSTTSTTKRNSDSSTTFQLLRRRNHNHGHPILTTMNYNTVRHMNSVNKDGEINKDVDVDVVDNSSSNEMLPLETCDVAIFGGGFGGLYTALAIAREYQQQQQKRGRRGRGRSTITGTQPPSLDIALVTPGDNFVFLPLLYDLTMGTASEMEVCPTYKSILAGTGIRHIKATLNDLDSPDGLSAKLTKIKRSTTTPTVNDKNNNNNKSNCRLSYRAAVVAVGATPQSILESIPGALEYTQPYYTKEHAEQTDQILKQLERKAKVTRPRIAIVGGGYGGVELAACIKRRIPKSHVSLLTRGPPMQGTRAESLINQALNRLGVTIQQCSVESVEPYISSSAANENVSNKNNDDNVVDTENGERYTTTATATATKTSKTRQESFPQQVIVKTKSYPKTEKTKKSTEKNDNNDEPKTTFDDDDADNEQEDEPWDAVLWTAGSGPAYPVTEGLNVLCKVTGSSPSSLVGRLATDKTLRCFWNDKSNGAIQQPRVWAMGDCADIVVDTSTTTPNYATPKTAQAAMQQADIVAHNILTELGILSITSTSTSTNSFNNKKQFKQFQYQDLGSLLTLGGPNAAVLAPKEDSPLAPLFAPAIDVARVGFGIADDILGQLLFSNKDSGKEGQQQSSTTTGSSSSSSSSLGQTIEMLGLSLGGYGLGVDPNAAGSGTLAGTFSGAARRAVYALRMPTNRQRIYAATSAAISTAAALAREASALNDERNNSKNGTNQSDDDDDA